MPQRIWAVGASVRAMAQSLVAAGFEVEAADMFCDADLATCVGGRMQRIQRFPHDLLRLVDHVRADAWIYAGGLENYPDLVDQLPAKIPLLGNPGDVLRRVRDPHWLLRTVREAGLEMPEMRFDAPRQVDGWLRKSSRSSGGLRVRRAQLEDSSLAADEYFQRYVQGQSHGATFLGAGAGTQLLGICRQLTEASWTGAPGFHYAGSVGPIELPDAHRAVIERLGVRLALAAGLRGWFGVDFILGGTGLQPEIYILEVNPRFPASLELLERSCGASSARWHAAACRGEPTESISWPRPQQICGKAILYSHRDLVISTEDADRFLDLAQQGIVADVPGRGTSVLRGTPLMTKLASGQTLAEVFDKLQTTDFVKLCLGVSQNTVVNIRPRRDFGAER